MFEVETPAREKSDRELLEEIRGRLDLLESVLADVSQVLEAAKKNAMFRSFLRMR